MRRCRLAAYSHTVQVDLPRETTLFVPESFVSDPDQRRPVRVFDAVRDPRNCPAISLPFEHEQHDSAHRAPHVIAGEHDDDNGGIIWGGSAQSSAHGVRGCCQARELPAFGKDAFRVARNGAWTEHEIESYLTVWSSLRHQMQHSSSRRVREWLAVCSPNSTGIEADRHSRANRERQVLRHVDP